MKTHRLYRGKKQFCPTEEWVYGYLESADRINNYKLQKETVGQSLGAIALDGGEVYEDDVVRCKTEWSFGVSEMIGKVIYDKGTYKVRGKVLNGSNGVPRQFPIFEVWDIEVIGNVFDNPKLADYSEFEIEGVAK